MRRNRTLPTPACSPTHPHTQLRKRQQRHVTYIVRRWQEVFGIGVGGLVPFDVPNAMTVQRELLGCWQPTTGVSANLLMTRCGVLRVVVVVGVGR